MNRLAKERSPYLRSAADQPIHWHPWAPEAFAKARSEGKPILLDVGAVWCHWCHVMDHESYEDPEVGKFVNREFVAIKVDRDERPDVDARYQKSVQALTGTGGWPLTAFLTPSGDVFYAGTYFPPVASHGRPAFRDVLEAVADAYRKDVTAVESQAKELRNHLRRTTRTPLRQLDGRAPSVLGDAIPQEISNHALASVDMEWGGFGTAPKFPHTAAVDLLLRRQSRTGSASLRAALEITLDGMRRGGVHDRVGGGFHRYGTDARWVVPHFEKMLYDNAGLLGNYVHAWQLWRRPEDARVAAGIIRFLRAVLEQPGGGFGGSQDADRGPGDDGSYFTWTGREVEDVLSPDEWRLVSRIFDLGEGARGAGRMPHGDDRSVLFDAVPLDAVAAVLRLEVNEAERTFDRALGKLAEARAKRPPPFVDPTIYTGWNGMAITALLEARALASSNTPAAGEEATKAALRALDRILKEAWSDAGFAHLCGAGAEDVRHLDDQAHMGFALTEAFTATGDARFLDSAVRTAEALARFWTGTAFVDRLGAAEVEFLKEEEAAITDSPTPNATATAARFLRRLGDLTGAQRYRTWAIDALSPFVEAANRFGMFASAYGLAVDEFVAPPPTIRLVGIREDASAWETAIAIQFVPSAALLRVGSASGVQGPAAIVCFGDRCLAPVFVPADLSAQLAPGGVR